MPFLSFVMFVLFGAAIWWWRLKRLGELGNDVVESAKSIRGAYRRRNFRRKAEAAPLDAIANPAVAAAVFLHCVAREKPASYEIAKSTIEQQLRTVMTEREIGETMIFAEWVSRSVVNSDIPVRRFKKLWLEALDHNERRHLVEMTQVVAAFDGPATSLQIETITSLKRALLNG